ncbi:hypothetical protein BJY26_003046 [Spelaeicoccus albus]|uniref:Uncharacterized protein n=1 Tax=Spelaeicoccus albus TaxID=1280376 RepID=A0A7Z0D4L0_9MICO|nr:hypothetical protein [Spelaeicoccus albus]
MLAHSIGATPMIVAVGPRYWECSRCGSGVSSDADSRLLANLGRCV